jgi:hypothetical protein
LFVKAVAELRQALAANPRQPHYRRELRNQYQNLGWTLVQLGDHAAAVRTATDLAGVFPRQAQDSYYAACLIARCVPFAKEDRTADEYRDKAVAFLRMAAGTATPDLKRIPDESQVFQALAPHAAFNAVLAQLDAKVRRAP